MDSLTPQIPAALRQTASSSRILLSFLVGFLILLLPWHGMGLWFRPDLLGLLIIYWGVYEPYAVGTGTAFLLGFLMDFAESHVFGIHGLTYSLLYFLIQFYRVRILSFYRLNQMLHVWVLLAVSQWAEYLINGILGYTWPAWPLWLFPPLTGAILWLMLPLFPDRSPRPVSPT
ncbi:MAG: rod shape-determining protein MreD [Betaproteobacteria bacterium]|jgi:rod shape-determining protein MreD|nr:rod shape-determining protein MreD [Betaproteobacteria bacterium]